MTWRKFKRFFSNSDDSGPVAPTEGPGKPVWPKLHKTAHGTIMAVHEDGRVSYPEEDAAMKAALREDWQRLPAINAERIAQGKPPVGSLREARSEATRIPREYTNY